MRRTALRRTALRRGKPPKRYTPIRRRAPIRRSAMAATRVQPSIPANVRVQLRLRSDHLCEIRRVPGCQQWATTVHHRITTKAGGRHGQAKVEHDQLSDLLDACFNCHDWVTNNPTEAGEAGWSLDEGTRPAEEWVSYRGELAYLDNDGGVWGYEAVGA